MKKVFAIVMALCLMLGMGVTVLAQDNETTHYGIFINCEWDGSYLAEVTGENKDDVLGDGTVSYNPVTNTLYLKNAKLECEGAVIYYCGTGEKFTINLEGNNVFGSEEKRADISIHVDRMTFESNIVCEFVLTGSGNLTIYDDNKGIFNQNGDITIDMTGKLTIDEESRGAECCIYANNGDINIEGGDIDLKAINGNCFDVYGDNKVNITGGRLKLHSNWWILSSENGINTKLPIEISDDGENYTEGTAEQLCMANYGRINWLGNEQQNKLVKNETETIVIDLKGGEKPEEVEENPNTGAPVLGLIGAAVLAGTAEVYMLKRRK